MPERRIVSEFIAGPAGRLEALLEEPEHGPPNEVALVCHPHPRHGGTMHNKVAYRAAEALFESGLPTLRFNFRGVGRSEGTWGGGEGEEEDAAAAVAFVGELYPGLPVLLGGFSFGGGVALAVGARTPAVAALLTVAPAVAARDLSALARCPKPKGVIQGTADELCPLPALQASYAAWAEPKAARLVGGAGHFFEGRLAELRAAALELLAEPAMAAALRLGRETA